MQTWYNALKYFPVNYMKIRCQLRKEYQIVTWNCHLHSQVLGHETVMCIMHCRKRHLHNSSKGSHLHNYNEIVTHIFAAETVTCISATETSNCIIATERFTNITVTKSTTCIIAMEPRDLHNCNKHHVYNCYRKCQLRSWKNFHLQKWCQSEVLLITIKKLGKWVSTKFKAKWF